MADWYRRKSWTKIDEEEFFAKLGRARKDGRSQYLKIQAIELVETQDKYLLDVAETLLNKVLTEYSDDSFHISSVLHTLGDIYNLRQNYDKAMHYYKQSLDFEKTYPHVITNSYLDLSELVIKTDKKELFGFVEKLMLDRIEGQIFPIMKYKMYSILSIINKDKGNIDQAKQYAALADQNANAQTSGLQYHKYLGIVTKRDNWLDKLVKGR